MNPSSANKTTLPTDSDSFNMPLVPNEPTVSKASDVSLQDIFANDAWAQTKEGREKFLKKIKDGMDRIRNMTDEERRENLPHIYTGKYQSVPMSKAMSILNDPSSLV